MLQAQEVASRGVDTDPGEVLLTSKQVRHGYGGVSGMTIWRWTHDDALGFPKPVKVNKRNFWIRGELDAFDAKRTAARDGKAA